MTELQRIEYCKISDYFIKENGVLLKDVNNSRIFKTDFISANNFLVEPVINKVRVAEPHVTVIESIYNHFRGPCVAITNNGVMICIFGAKTDGSGDFQPAVGAISRSFDMGLTFETPTMLVDNNHVDERSRAGCDQLLLDKVTNRLFAFGGSVDNHIEGPIMGVTLDPPYIWDIFYIYSDDDGATWSDKVSLKPVLMTDPLSNAFQNGASSVGIQLDDGTLVLTVYDIRQSDNLALTGNDWSMRTAMVYSTDHGDTWHRSTDLPSITNEATQDYVDGEIYITARQYTPPSKRIFKTSDFGETWVTSRGDNKLAGFQTQTSSLKVKNTHLFCCPASLTDRTLLMIHTSKKLTDFMKFLMIDAEPIYGYSSIAHYQNRLFVFYEKWDGMWLADISDYLKYID
ncbi:MAG: sialidase family protein [Ignavibacteriaceae bacterium]|jgi:hypothetical protein|nr:sialidase family protein [Ignavibacteriaceae bacterium]